MYCRGKAGSGQISRSSSFNRRNYSPQKIEKSARQPDFPSLRSVKFDFRARRFTPENRVAVRKAARSRLKKYRRKPGIAAKASRASVGWRWALSRCASPVMSPRTAWSAEGNALGKVPQDQLEPGRTAEASAHRPSAVVEPVHAAVAIDIALVDHAISPASPRARSAMSSLGTGGLDHSARSVGASSVAVLGPSTCSTGDPHRLHVEIGESSNS